MRDYKKYEIWKLGHHLALEVYKISERFPREEIFGMTSQLSRAIISVNFNIVEGCGRGSDEDFKRMLTIASGSSFEVDYALLLSHDLGFISDQDYAEISPKSEELKMKISKLILKIQEDIEKKNKEKGNKK